MPAPAGHEDLPVDRMSMSSRCGTTQLRLRALDDANGRFLAVGSAPEHQDRRSRTGSATMISSSTGLYRMSCIVRLNFEACP